MFLTACASAENFANVLDMQNRSKHARDAQIKVADLADENTSAQVLLVQCSDELKKLRSKKAYRIADEILAIAQRINEFHWQTPRTPWN
jgi:hypothetical protein